MTWDPGHETFARKSTPPREYSCAGRDSPDRPKCPSRHDAIMPQPWTSHSRPLQSQLVTVS